MSIGVRRAMTIAEVLVALGLVGVLLSLVLVVAGSTRRGGDRARCLMTARHAAVGVIGYSLSHAEAFPLGVAQKGPGRWVDLESGGALVGPGAVFFTDGLKSGYLGGVTWSWVWAMRQGEESAAWADERSVACPMGDRYANLRGRDGMSAALYVRPELLESDVTMWTDDAARLQRVSVVRSPSRKALLFESASFHAAEFDPWWSADVGGVTVGAVDGSVVWRDRATLTPGQLLVWDGFPAGSETVRRGLGAMHYTPHGVRGRDW